MVSPNSKLALVPALPRKPLKVEHVHPDILEHATQLAQEIQSALPNLLSWNVFDSTIGEKLMAEVRRNMVILEARKKVSGSSISVEENSPQTLLAQEQIDCCGALHQQWRQLNMLNRGLWQTDPRQS